jgi:hypothetical protein
VGVTPGMRILTEADGFPPLMSVEIGLVFAPGKPSQAVEALADHIRDSLTLLDRPQVAAE